MGWGSNQRKEHYICKRVCKEKPVKQGSKNISIKMLKDVGMTVPKSRETSAVYMQQDRDEGNIYAARQGMRACNNNMRNPSLHLFYYGVTHVIIVACPHPLSCCIYIALIPCLAAYILPSSPVLLHIYTLQKEVVILTSVCGYLSCIT